MTIDSDLLYLLTGSASIGGSYLLMNYKSNSQEKKIKLLFEKLDNLQEKSIIYNEKLSELSVDKKDIADINNRIDKITENNSKYLTVDTAESKFITRNEFNIYIKNLKDQNDRVEQTMNNLNVKLDNIYNQLITLSNKNIHDNTTNNNT